MVATLDVKKTSYLFISRAFFRYLEEAVVETEVVAYAVLPLVRDCLLIEPPFFRYGFINIVQCHLSAWRLLQHRGNECYITTIIQCSKIVVIIITNNNKNVAIMCFKY